MGGRSFTIAQVEYLKSIAHMPNRDMCAMFNSKFGENKSERSMKDFCYRNRLIKGLNSGRFKKGQIPWNKDSSVNIARKKPSGHEWVDCDGYTWVKVDGIRKMVLKHRHIWESVNGKIPEGSMIVFKDKNRSNCNIDNLMIVSRPELVRYNFSFSKIATTQTNETYLLMAKLKSAIGSKCKD